MEVRNSFRNNLYNNQVKFKAASVNTTTSNKPQKDTDSDYVKISKKENTLNNIAWVYLGVTGILGLIAAVFKLKK